MIRKRRGGKAPVDSFDSSTDRELWIEMVSRIGTPVLEAAAERCLRESMPVEVGPDGSFAERADFSHFEAVGRLLAGLAPWLEIDDGIGTEEERALRSSFRGLAQEAIRSGADPNSPDRFTVEHERPQPLVDAAFLAIALLRAPNTLWYGLDDVSRENLLMMLRNTRKFQPYFNNWLLFPAAVEAFLLSVGEVDWDPVRIDYALRQHEEWYRGDGTYGDGPEFHWDYYNSYVTHPLLLDIIEAAQDHVRDARNVKPQIVKRAMRFAEIQERMIAPDGSYPPIGRSLAYRTGAFHLLAQAVLRRLLPATLAPGQVRSALTAVLRRQMAAPGTFDTDGWLTIGLAGHQPSLGERYISTGSLYLCSSVFLPLGLPSEDDFWASAGQPWTSVQAWSGHDMAPDRALRSDGGRG